MAWGQEPATAQRSVRASGEAVVYAKPDRATIEIDVSAQDGTAQAAAAQSVTKTQAVLAKLRAAMGAGGDLESSGYSLYPQYDRADRGPLRLTGYNAESSITLVTEDLAAVARLVDTATAAGATEIRSVRFSSKDVTEARSKALREAAGIARKYAAALAAAQGLKLGRILSLEEADKPEWASSSMANSVAMPSGGNTLAVRASVTVTVAIE
jgi:hypothetical protein